MTRRRHSLEQALTDMNAGTLARDCRIVVSWTWWDGLAESERDAYQRRCAMFGVRLSADHRISRHFVEVVGPDEPPLSSEYHV